MLQCKHYHSQREDLKIVRKDWTAIRPKPSRASNKFCSFRSGIQYIEHDNVNSKSLGDPHAMVSPPPAHAASLGAFLGICPTFLAFSTYGCSLRHRHHIPTLEQRAYSGTPWGKIWPSDPFPRPSAFHFCFITHWLSTRIPQIFLEDVSDHVIFQTPPVVSQHTRDSQSSEYPHAFSVLVPCSVSDLNIC